jgi:D-beta-D-heptose 7-phosphate kinase/D-beta-D-heptose 1-phosphate adenosyltransferase
MLDEFVWGNVGRISPEAPVPVVEVDRDSSDPGGAANVARNLREFTSSVTLLGMVGNDPAGTKLEHLLGQEGISTEGLFKEGEVPTIVKTRIIAQRQQVVRIDREIRSPSGSSRPGVMAAVPGLVAGADAIVIEDYGKGFVDQALVEAILEASRKHGTLVTCDPNPKNPLEWNGLAAIKPNRSEAFAAAGRTATPSLHQPMQDEALREVGEILLRRWNAGALLVTLSEQGMMLFRQGQEPYHTPTKAREIFDVSGAGDTSISLYTLAIAGGATPVEAAELANHAAGIVVGKLGTATCSRSELEASFLAGERF